MSDFGRQNLTESFFPEDRESAMPLSTVQTSREDQERLSRYSVFWEYYNGRHWKHKRQDGEDNITVNFCRLFVNKGASFLAGKGWEIKDREKPYSEKQLEFVNQVWRSANKDLFTFETAQMGGALGDACATVLPNNMGGVAIKSVPPMYVSPLFHPSNRDQLLGAKIEFPIYANDRSRTKRVMTTLLDSMSMSQYIDGTLVSSQAHNLGEVPLVWFRNRPEFCSSFGSSDLAPILPINKLVNEKMTDMSDTINYLGNPITVMYGVNVRQMQRGARKVWFLPKDARAEHLGLNGQLADSDAHLKHLISILMMLAEMPEAAFGKDMAISNTTGVALQVLFQPLLDVTRIKQATYGKGLADINRLIIKYGINYGYLERPYLKNWFDLEEYFQTDICWANPLPTDEMIKLNMIINRLNSGLITVADALTQLGVANVKQYIQLLIQDREQGLNINLAKMLTSLAGQINTNPDQINLGGVARNGATVAQTSDIALGQGPDNQLSKIAS